MDRRAWAVCPLMEWGKAGLSKEFEDAVAEAGKTLYACPAHAEMLDAIHDYNQKLKQF